MSAPLRGGAVAQLGERLVRNEEARGSNPLSSTTVPLFQSVGIHDRRELVRKFGTQEPHLARALAAGRALRLPGLSLRAGMKRLNWQVLIALPATTVEDLALGKRKRRRTPNRVGCPDMQVTVVVHQFHVNELHDLICGFWLGGWADFREALKSWSASS